MKIHAMRDFVEEPVIEPLDSDVQACIEMEMEALERMQRRFYGAKGTDDL